MPKWGSVLLTKLGSSPSAMMATVWPVPSPRMPPLRMTLSSPEAYRICCGVERPGGVGIIVML